jgi:hypothetical protein
LNICFPSPDGQMRAGAAVTSFRLVVGRGVFWAPGRPAELRDFALLFPGEGRGPDWILAFAGMILRGHTAARSLPEAELGDQVGVPFVVLAPQIIEQRAALVDHH